MNRHFLAWMAIGLALATALVACGHRQSAPINRGGGELQHAKRYRIDLGRTPAAGSKFRVQMATTTVSVTHAEVDGQQQKQSDQRTVVSIEATTDVLASTVRGITKATYTIQNMSIDGAAALPSETVVTFDRNAEPMLSVGEAKLAPDVFSAFMGLVTGLEPLNDDALVGLSRDQAVGATWEVDALSAAVEFEKAGIHVDPDQIHGESHFAQLSELEGIPSMTIQSELELRGARPKRAAPGTDVLPSSYEVKSEITAPLRLRIATLRDERSRTHSVVKLRTLKANGEPDVHLTLTTTSNQALRLRPVGEVADDGFVEPGWTRGRRSPTTPSDESPAPAEEPQAPTAPTAPTDSNWETEDGEAPEPVQTWDPGAGMDSGFPGQ